MDNEAEYLDNLARELNQEYADHDAQYYGEC